VQTGKFVRRLENQGRVFGVKFRPGGFYPFVKAPVVRFTNASSTLWDTFGVEGTALEAAVFSREEASVALTSVELFLRERLPMPDERVSMVNEIVDWISIHPSIIKVDDVVSHFHLTKRTVQRLFRQYVGVSPKWVIQRFRLHEVAERLSDGEQLNWPNIVVELGYSDQAHLIKDFKSVVGATPAAYARSFSERSTGLRGGSADALGIR
jgi:AraC-like DNA-binding protein